MSVLPFKEDEDFRKHNQHAEEHAADELQDFFPRLFRRCHVELFAAGNIGAAAAQAFTDGK